MTIPMPKKEYISIQMTTEHRNRYNILTDALLERQQSDRSYLAACYLLSADEDIFDIAKPYVSFDGIDFAAIRMRVKSALVLTTNTPPLKWVIVFSPGVTAK